MGTDQGFTPWQRHRLRVTAKDNRLFIEAVLWIARTGSPWRDLDPALGNWHATYTRFSRWGKKGVWQRIIAAIRQEQILKRCSSTARSYEPTSTRLAPQKRRPASPRALAGRAEYQDSSHGRCVG